MFGPNSLAANSSKEVTMSLLYLLGLKKDTTVTGVCMSLLTVDRITFDNVATLLSNQKRYCCTDHVCSSLFRGHDQFFQRILVGVAATKLI